MDAAPPTARRRNAAASAALLMGLWAGLGPSDAWAADPVEEALGALLTEAPALAGAWAVAVVDVDAEGSPVVLSAGSRDALNLASNAKILSTAAALRRFGPEHRFETHLHGALGEGGQVDGDLVVVGGGDPGLALSDLAAMADALAAAGVRRIGGAVVVFDGLFAGSPLPPAYEQKDTDAAYRPSVAAFGVGDNVVSVGFRPGARGEPVRISLIPSSDYCRIDNQSKTVAGAADRLEIRAIDGEDGRTTLRVRGTLGERYRGAAVRRRIADPSLHAAYALLEQLDRAGVTVADRAVRRSRTPPTTPILHRASSGTLAEHARVTNFDSNNARAEVLFRHVGRPTQGDGPATWEASQAAVAALLAEAGVPADRVRILNGSGLYEADFVPAEGMARFLAWVARQEGLGPAFEQTLARAGKEGWLARRMRGTPAEGVVRAKTGTLDDVIALSGYATTQGGRRLAFSFLFNGLKKGPNAPRRWQDRACAALCGLP